MEKRFKLIGPQADFVLTPARHPAYVAAWGTGKSLSGISRGLRLSKEFPNNLGMVFRKQFTDLQDSTIKDFENYTGMKPDSHREVTLENGSKIMFRHIEELANLQNVNLGWFWIEQAEELDSDEQFFVLWGRLRRENTKHSGFITANTKGHNWIWRLWKQKELKDGELLEAKTHDNAANLPQAFIESLEILKVNKPKIYNRFVLNSWDESDTVDVIIQPSWVEAAKGRLIIAHHPVRRVVSIDVARGGADKSVFYCIEDNKVLAFETWETRNTMELVGRAQVFAKKFNTGSFAVDEIGVGGGVVDRLKELDYEVIPVNAAEREKVPDPYFNRRAEILGYGAQLFEDGKVSILKDDIELAEQLSWTKWKPMKSNGTLQAESKDDVRETFGRSPDNSDAFLNGLWALPKCSPANGGRNTFSPVGSVSGGDRRGPRGPRGASFRRYQQRSA